MKIICKDMFGDNDAVEVSIKLTMMSDGSGKLLGKSPCMYYDDIPVVEFGEGKVKRFNLSEKQVEYLKDKVELETSGDGFYIFFEDYD